MAVPFLGKEVLCCQAFRPLVVVEATEARPLLEPCELRQPLP